MDHLIPAPQGVLSGQGSFHLTADTPILYDHNYSELETVAVWLAEQLSAEFAGNQAEAGNVSIRVELTGSPAIHSTEEYELVISPESIRLIAPETTGLFHAARSLVLMLPPTPAGSVDLPAVHLKDWPRFAWRGFMLDVARHFFTVADVKRVIDMISLFKINRLHLHLADDQGWRIEIPSWPELTRIGSRSAVDGDPGGYYTRADITEIVNYAHSRQVLVIPEIDLPGHTNAALASYPELNSDGKARELYTGIEVGFSSLDPHLEVTYRFIDDVVREIAEISPDPWFHIGGDEAAATNPADYPDFIRRVAEIVRSHGKELIGWEEIGKADLGPGTCIQTWRTEDITIPPAGSKLILSPANRIYVDMKYNEHFPLGLFWAGYVEVKDAYDWDPAEVMAGVSETDILGVEAALWTETIRRMEEIETMIFPRLTAVAEIGWSARANRDWQDYRKRLGRLGKWLDARGIHYYHSPQIDWAIEA
jgi:hexosaminidase